MTLDDIGVIVKQIILKSPFYGMFLMGLQKEDTKEVDVAGVRLEGINYKLAINLEAFEKIPKEEQFGIILHEVFHICHHHCTMKWGDHIRQNIAMDLFINCILREEGYSLPVWVCYPEKFGLEKDLSSKEYYNLLDENKLVEQIKEALANGKNAKWQHNWKDFDGTNELKDLINSQVEFQMKKTAEHCRNQGYNFPQELSNYLNGLFVKHPPKYDWKKLFRRFIDGNINPYRKSTKKRINKRFEDAKGHKYKYKPSVILYLDGSGSMGLDDMEKCFSEINHIYKEIAVDIAHFDAHVAEPYRYRGEKELPKSNGGTCFNNVRNHFNDSEYDMGVILTDGYAEQVRNFNKPLLWLITTRNGFEQCKNQPGIKIKLYD